MKYLPWDSEFFNLHVGKVEVASICQSKFSELIDKANNENYDLIYLISTEPIEIDQRIMSDVKVTFSFKKPFILDFDNNHCELISEGNLDLNQYKSLIKLTYLSGHKSRFRIDSNFQTKYFKRLYKTWLDRSLNGEIADYVLAVIIKNKIYGFVTLKVSDKNAKVGLIAVDKQSQGKGIGEKLMQGVFKIANELGLTSLEVDTQEINEQAIHFYSKLGMKISSKQYIYHLWIKYMK